MTNLKKYLIVIVSFVVFTLAYSNCSQTGFQTKALSSALSATSISTGTPSGTTSTVASDGNRVAITVGCGYVNEPCVSVTICVPGTTQCQVINNLLLDTGSTGLRIFSGATNLNLPGVNDSAGHPYGTCAVYGDGTYQWGPVKTADVTLGSDIAHSMPIELIDFTFGDSGANCKALAGSGGIQDALSTGYNGIIGVQFFQQDCGGYCQTQAGNELYYGCAGSTCTSEEILLANQLPNPIGALSSDNNGFSISLPAVSNTGAANVTGTLLLGIGTQSNNAAGSATVYAADPNYGFIYTNFNNSNYEAVIDSGSMGYYFPDASIPSCTGATGWYCPSSSQMTNGVMELVGQIKDANEANAKNLGFYVASALQLYQPNTAFNDLAGPMPSNIPAGSTGFIWGFPFFTGRTVYVGLEPSATATSPSTSLGNGPYWAF